MVNQPSDNQIADSIVIRIRNFIDECNNTQKAYFWTPPNIASCRRSYEKKHNFQLNENFELVRKVGSKSKFYKVLLNCELRLECSCKNVYRICHLTLNNKTINLTVLKHLLKILTEESPFTSIFAKKYLS